MISSNAIQNVIEEANVAQAAYGPFNSTHEAYGVLAEEMDELLKAIRANNLDAIRTEAMQVAAVALRLSAENSTDFLSRSGC